MRKLFKNKKSRLFWTDERGNAFAWLIGLAALFFIALSYVAVTPAFEKIYNATAIPSNANYTQTRTMLETAWAWWPGLTLIGVILFALVQTLKQDTYGGYR